jgi:hypothetical protein
MFGLSSVKSDIAFQINEEVVDVRKSKLSQDIAEMLELVRLVGFIDVHRVGRGYTQLRYIGWSVHFIAGSKASTVHLQPVCRSN